MSNFNLIKIPEVTGRSTRIEIKESGEYYGLFIGKKDDFLDVELNFIHNNREISSKIIIKAVLYDDSSFNIKGNLIINKGAKLVDSYLKIDVLMLSEKATTQVIPSLEIMETDVKGGHGATIGQIDQAQKFYLMSRGLTTEAAEKLIVTGFIQELLNKAENSDQDNTSYLTSYLKTKQINGYQD